jgi:hypothetical protein
MALHDPVMNSDPNLNLINPTHAHVRAVPQVRTTIDAATPLAHRKRMLEIDVDGGRNVRVLGDDTPPLEPAHGAAADVSDIVLKVEVVGAPHIAPAMLTIPVSTDLNLLPPGVASNSV